MRWSAVVFLVGALLWAVVSVAVWLSLPAYETSSGGGVGTGDAEITYVETTSTSTLVEENGLSVLLVLAIPVLPPLVALAARRRRVTLTLAWLCTACCVVAILSIGVFYVPEVVLLFAAASRQ
jgi:hypothetical protein